MDFTLDKYRELLESLQKEGYHFLTFENYLENRSKDQPATKIIILRHDVDKKPQNALSVARIEKKLRIEASYYFRITPNSNDPGIISKIASLGHEIGYHYEDLSIQKGNKKKAWQQFKKHLDYFRQFYPVKTICMHGSPASGFDNKDIWSEFSYQDTGIIGEPYFDFLINTTPHKYYLTDTGRRWDGENYNVRDKINIQDEKSITVHSTDDLILWLSRLSKTKDRIHVMITTHPQRWSNNKWEWTQEYISQHIKNPIKYLLKKTRKSY